jgi:hypothetical protein
MDYERLYRYRFRAVDQSAREAVWGPIANYLYRALGQPETVLDPAAGRGEFVNAVPAAERWAVDRVAHDEIRADRDAKLLIGDVMTVELPADYFQGVLVSNFLEHLGGQEAIADFLERMWVVMRPGARIAVLGPNYRYLGKEYWDFADHVVPLTHRAVEEHLYVAGFTPVKTISRFLPYSFTGRLPASSRLTAAYLRVPLAWSLFGKQFLVIGRK